eukprot:275822-Prymnesium_polylepis.1
MRPTSTASPDGSGTVSPEANRAAQRSWSTRRCEPTRRRVLPPLTRGMFVGASGGKPYPLYPGQGAPRGRKSIPPYTISP